MSAGYWLWVPLGRRLPSKFGGAMRAIGTGQPSESGVTDFSARRSIVMALLRGGAASATSS